MPDILIRGVALPKYGCAGCYFKTGKYCGIIAKNENVEEYSLRAERHPDCPLLELPPHGDLIDRDAACERYKHDPKKPEICDGAQDLDWLVQCLNEAPAVVPAERSDTDA